MTPHFRTATRFVARITLVTLALATFSRLQAQPGGAPDQSPFILFWANPTRAYPGIPIDFRFVVYEKDNKPLVWSLVGAPAGMTIDANGKIHWIPTTADMGPHALAVRATRHQGDVIERPFTLTVGTSDFLFVSPSGSDTNSGTIAAPFRTIEHALQSIASGSGKTVYLRTGTYRETYNWETMGHPSPLRAKFFSAAAPVELRAYPGEAAILDGSSLSRGIVVFDTSYVIIDNVTVQNFSTVGIVITGCEHVIVRDTIVHETHGSMTDNVTGYQMEGVTDTVFDHAIGHDNFDRNSDFYNSSNFLNYCDSSIGINYILNCTSYNSVCGYKIKHAGPAQLALHNNRSHDDAYSYAIGSDYSSVRYCISYNSDFAVTAGMTDPSSYHDQGVTIEKNTFVNARKAAVLFYPTHHTQTPSTIRDNIFYNDIQVAGTGEDDYRLLEFWIYADTAKSYPMASDNNLFFSPSTENIIRLGRSTDGDYNFSFASWQDRGNDRASFFSDPLFNDFANQDFRPTANSAAHGTASDGGDIGALPCLTPTPDATAPTTPTNLKGTAISRTAISVTWTASTDNIGVTGYRVYRATGSGTPTEIATSVSSASYSDTGLIPATEYRYTVAAYDAASNLSSQSSAVTATTHAGDSYSTWRAVNFTGADLTNDAISGPAAEPDGGGVTNFQRYAFGLAARGRVAAPTTCGTVDFGGQHYLTITFDRRTAGTDLSYVVEASTNLSAWTTVTAFAPGSPARITAQDSVAMGAANRRFLRVRVTTP